MDIKTVLAILESIVIPVLVFILQAEIKDNRRIRNERKEENQEREKGIQEGVVALLRTQLIDNHKKYMREGSIPSYAYENWVLMHKAYKALGGNGMIEHMNEEIEDLPIRAAGTEAKKWEKR